MATSVRVGVELTGLQLVNSEMKFDPNASPPCYRSKDEIIQKDTKVRIEIVGCRVEATDIVSAHVL